jgi:hypothetical protein
VAGDPGFTPLRSSTSVIGRSEALPVLYLRCDDCGKTSVSPE